MLDINDITIKPHPRAKHLKLRVEPSGSVSLTIPKRTSQATINRFLAEQKSWLTRKLAQTRQYHRTNQILNWHTNTVSYLGDTYQFTAQSNLSTPIRLTEKKILIRHQTNHTQQLKQPLLKWLKSQAKEYLEYHAPRFAQQLEVNYQNLSIRQQKTRWGSCSSKGNLNFNWRLIHFKPEVIDYVIIHELTHRKHLNHSKKFWQLVKTHQPNYQTHRRFLKAQKLPIEKIS